MRQKIKRFVDNVVLGMVYGVMVAIGLALFAAIWWLDHIVFVY